MSQFRDFVGFGQVIMGIGTNENELIKPGEGELFDRVVSILEQARANVVRAVNSNMVIAYWLIGREIVQEIQGGEERAEYAPCNRERCDQ